MKFKGKVIEADQTSEEERSRGEGSDLKLSIFHLACLFTIFKATLAQ
jgi:hypothetical protein